MIIPHLNNQEKQMISPWESFQDSSQIQRVAFVNFTLDNQKKLERIPILNVEQKVNLKEKRSCVFKNRVIKQRNKPMKGQYANKITKKQEDQSNKQRQFTTKTFRKKVLKSFHSHSKDIKCNKVVEKQNPLHIWPFKIIRNSSRLPKIQISWI